MQTLAHLKGTARENLLGHYSTPICCYLIGDVVTSLLSIPFMRNVQHGFSSHLMFQTVSGFLGLFILILISVLFTAGLSEIHLKLAQKQETQLKDMLFPFKNHPDRFMGSGLVIVLLQICCLLPGFLLILQGGGILDHHSSTGLLLVGILLEIAGVIVAIILSIGFSMTTFILLEDPYGTGAMQALNRSWKITRGRRFRLFLLYLSFIGWGILGLLSFGLGFLWIAQYVRQSFTIAYLDLKQNI